jgi:isopenicillin-N epimerase
VAEPERAALRPLTTSWNHGQPFPKPFDTAGTDDYSGWLTLPTAAEFWRDAGGLGIGERGRTLLDAGAGAVDEAVRRTRLPRADVALPASPAPCLRLVALPDGVADTEERADAVYEALSAARVECQVVAFGGRGWIRLSGAVYNEPGDYERLAEELPGVLAG